MFAGLSSFQLISITSLAIRYSISSLFPGRVLRFIVATSRPSNPSAPGPGPSVKASTDASLGPCWFCPFCWHRNPRLYFPSALRLDLHFKEKHGELYAELRNRSCRTLNQCAYCGKNFSFLSSWILDFSL